MTHQKSNQSDHTIYGINQDTFKSEKGTLLIIILGQWLKMMTVPGQVGHMAILPVDKKKL